MADIYALFDALSNGEKYELFCHVENWHHKWEDECYQNLPPEPRPGDHDPWGQLIYDTAERSQKFTWKMLAKDMGKHLDFSKLSKDSKGGHKEFKIQTKVPGDG